MRIDLDDDRLAALKRDYEADAESLATLAARFALSPHALRRIARDMHFAPRPKAKPFARKGAPPAAPTAAPHPPAAAAPAARPAPPLRPLDLSAMAQRVQSSVERELGKIHDELEAGADVERRARTLASLVKTLGDLARLEEARAAGKPAAAGPDDGAWNIDDLRAEVARRLDRMAQGEPG
ncbi:MAG: hypothetical protein JNK46_18640 [Methylobacteriaceae bacterium]|nr:hypothetical protein [Methylobacteriaceae bacterium]